MNNLSIVAKEGWKIIAISFGVSIVLRIIDFDFLGNMGLLFTLFLVFVYRNPERSVYSNENEILSPIDGRVSAIDFCNGKMKIYIDVSLCDTHILRAPVDGKFSIDSFNHGLNLNPISFKAKKLNEQMVLKFSHLKLKLLSGVCNNKIKVYESNKELKKGDRFGLFLHGIAEIDFDDEVSPSVQIGDKIKAANTIIGRFARGTQYAE